jgi:hypothetical protein
VRNLLLILTTTILGAGGAQAQVRVEVDAPPPPRVVVRAPPPPQVVVPPPPAIRFEAAPPLVTVQPGVEVVRDCDEEVFFSGGWYWHPGPRGVWYRTRSWHGGWVAAPRRAVPGAIVRLPRGHYRHFRGEGEGRREWREERHEAKAERHWEHREEKAERHWEHREEKAERHWEHGRRHGG